MLAKGRPARHALPPRHFGLVQPLPQQPQGFEPSPFQSIKITLYSRRVSRTTLEAQDPECDSSSIRDPFGPAASLQVTDSLCDRGFAYRQLHFDNCVHSERETFHNILRSVAV